MRWYGTEQIILKLPHFWISKKNFSLPYPTIFTNSGMFMTTNVKCQHFFMHEKYQLQKHLAFYLKYSVAMQLFCIYAVTHFWFYFVLTYYLLIIFLTFYGYFSNFANLLDNGTSWMKWNCNFRLLRQKKNVQYNKGLHIYIPKNCKK